MADDKNKKKELTEKQKLLLAALFGEAEGNYREALRIAGYSENTSVKEAIEPLREEIMTHANSYLISLVPKTVFKQGKMLDDPNLPGAPNLMRVIDSILNRVGMTEKRAGDEVNVRVPSGGLFILPAKEVQEFRRVDNETDDETE
jgi:hypothetical protein